MISNEFNEFTQKRKLLQLFFIHKAFLEVQQQQISKRKENHKNNQ